MDITSPIGPAWNHASNRIVPAPPATQLPSTLFMDPASLPPALLRQFGGPRDVFVVRLFSRLVDEAIGECMWRARGQWDCNEREMFAAYHALANCMREATGREAVPFSGWGAADYAAFMVRG